MQQLFMRHARQPQVAVASLSVALVMLASSYGWDAGSLSTVSLGTLALAGALVAICLLAYQFPIYIRHNTKVCVVSVPLYLMAVLLPPPMAATVMGLAVFSGEMLTRRTRGTYPSDIVTTAARWILVGLTGSLIAHAPLTTHNLWLQASRLTLAAPTLWLGDLLTLPLVLVPISGESPSRIVKTVIREGSVAEAAQYLLGLIGAFAALHQVWALGMLAIPALLVYLAFKKELDDDTFELLESIADTVDLRDPYTGGHSRRVAALTEQVLEALGMHGQEARLIRTAARIHDIGKMTLPDTLLIKAGSLSPEEEAIIQSYPDWGVELLSRYPDFSRGIEMVKHHHERWDGLGYPQGLQGGEIPFGARLIAVVDSFDAMTSDRPYRRALSIERAAEILRDGRGRQWDPKLVDAFLQTIGHSTVEPTPAEAAEREAAERPAASAGARQTVVA